MQRNIIFIVTTACWPPSSDEGRKRLLCWENNYGKRKLYFRSDQRLYFVDYPPFPWREDSFCKAAKIPLFFSSTCCDPWHSLLFSEAYSREQTQIVQKIISEHNGSDFVFAEDPEAKKELWKVPILNCSTLYWIFFFC